MKRTTVMAPDDLLAELERIARREEISLAEVIRQGLELRVERARQLPTFIASGASSPSDTGRRSADLPFEPPAWR